MHTWPVWQRLSIAEERERQDVCSASLFEAMFIVKRKPKPYALTEQQEVFKEALESCGIKKGITRAELVNAMRTCIPKFYEKRRNDN